MSHSRKRLNQGFTDSIPIVAGFIPACFTFGLVGKGLGLGNLEVLLMSALVFAGASQFIGVKLLAAGTAAPVILLLTLIVNLRYVFISFSFAGKLKRNISVIGRMLVGFTLTEEVYAVSMMSREQQPGKVKAQGEEETLSLPYLLGLQLPPYAVSLFSTAAGISLAAYIPSLYLPALNTSLYALLIALVVPQLRGSLRNLTVCVSAALSSWLLHPWLGNSTVLAAMVIGMGAGSLFRNSAAKAARGEV